MTKDEAEKVIAILLEADNGCEHCVRNLYNVFKDEFPEFPEFKELIYKLFDARFKK